MAETIVANNLGPEDAHSSLDEDVLRAACASKLKGLDALADFLDHINLQGEQVRSPGCQTTLLVRVFNVHAPYSKDQFPSVEQIELQ